ncbi:hypothetical protein D3C72_1317730 [compost metagenome]
MNRTMMPAPTAVETCPALMASAPSSAPTTRRSSTFSGAGRAPPFSRLTSSEADWIVKLPVI